MDNNNKPRNVLKREEYEILALKNQFTFILLCAVHTVEITEIS